MTYGPFPGGWPRHLSEDFSQIAAAGFNAVRLYEMPSRVMLDAADACGLSVFAGLQWDQNVDFFRQPGAFTAARVKLVESLREIGDHPALAAVSVGNEIPADLVRWMGPLKVRAAIEELIELGRTCAPQLMFAYANYPSTEYLEPANADFTAFNIFLEEELPFREYVKRLHHIAGDRPLVISEFGLDSLRHGVEKQAEVLRWATRAARELETAGITIFSWSDRWLSAGIEVLDWNFGLTDRDGNPKPALTALQNLTLNPPAGPEPIEGNPSSLNSFTVIVCTRNGRRRLARCLRAIARMEGEFETLVVDDGSTDGTASFIANDFPDVRLVVSEPIGLSAARNLGAAHAKGDILAFTDDDCEPDREWLLRLSPLFQDDRFAAVGGPNLPPPARNWEEAVIRAAPGAPSHVMIDDEEAEHLPGCNIAVTREAFEKIGGFDTRFHTAGDDVDFCWRLRDAGYRLGFAPGAFVWHWRRPGVQDYLRQQAGYGIAERLLLEKHPQRFSKNGDAQWHGFVYGGGPVRVVPGSIIHFGPMGAAGFQGIINRTLPLRGLEARFSTAKSRFFLELVRALQPMVRAWYRNFRIRLPSWKFQPRKQVTEIDEFAIQETDRNPRQHYLDILIARGWRPCNPTEPWDLKIMRHRVIMAQEKGEGGLKDVLVRIRNFDADELRKQLNGKK